MIGDAWGNNHKMDANTNIQIGSAQNCSLIITRSGDNKECKIVDITSQSGYTSNGFRFKCEDVEVNQGVVSFKGKKLCDYDLFAFEKITFEYLKGDLNQAIKLLCEITGKDEPVSDENNNDACCICFENKKCCALKCGHCCLCISCANSFQKQDPVKCPICREDVTGEEITKIFM